MIREKDIFDWQLLKFLHENIKVQFGDHLGSTTNGVPQGLTFNNNPGNVPGTSPSIQTFHSWPHFNTLEFLLTISLTSKTTSPPYRGKYSSRPTNSLESEDRRNSPDLSLFRILIIPQYRTAFSIYNYCDRTKSYNFKKELEEAPEPTDQHCRPNHLRPIWNHQGLNRDSLQHYKAYHGPLLRITSWTTKEANQLPIQPDAASHEPTRPFSTTSTWKKNS